MRVLIFLFRSARRPFAAAVLAAIVAGFASAGILMLINRLISYPERTHARQLVWSFAALCLLVPLSRFGSSATLLHLSQKTIFDLRVHLCGRILSAPLRQLEEVGPHRLMAALTSDIGAMAMALTTLPLLCMNAAVVLGSLVYLGWLSWQMLLLVLAALAIGVVCYRVPTRWGTIRQRRAREEGDVLYQHFRATTEGTKELKVHRPRRRAFLAQLADSATAYRRHSVAAQSIFVGAASFGQALVFIVAGIVILVIPGMVRVDREVITGFALVLLYLMTPLQAILNVLPELSQAGVAMAKVEQLGLSLTGEVEDGRQAPAAEEPPGTDWGEIELAGVVHSYAHESDDRQFTLGPIDLKLRRGEVVFVIGGNGSGKTTLLKLIAGLYAPQQGRLLLGGEEVTGERRERYRQLFSVVFSDFFLFQELLGLDHPELDARARSYLEQLELARKVKVEDGRLSTTELSQGQRKRLALLTAYLENRPVYLFDEWAADQDPVYKEVFYRQVVPGLRSRGKTVLVICHDDRYFHLADRLVKLDSGKIVLDEERAVEPPASHLGRPAFGAPIRSAAGDA